MYAKMAMQTQPWSGLNRRSKGGRRAKVGVALFDATMSRKREIRS